MLKILGYGGIFNKMMGRAGIFLQPSPAPPLDIYRNAAVITKRHID